MLDRSCDLLSDLLCYDDGASKGGADDESVPCFGIALGDRA